MPAPLWKGLVLVLPSFIFLYRFFSWSPVVFLFLDLGSDIMLTMIPPLCGPFFFWASDHWDGWQYMPTLHRSLQSRSLDVAGWFKRVSLLPIVRVKNIYFSKTQGPPAVFMFLHIYFSIPSPFSLFNFISFHRKFSLCWLIKFPSSIGDFSFGLVYYLA